MQVDHHIVVPVWVELGQRRVDAVGTARQRGVGHHRDPAFRANGLGDLGIGTGDRDRPDVGLARTVEHVQDHGPAMDDGQRLAGQAGGGHAGGDDDDRVHALTGCR